MPNEMGNGTAIARRLAGPVVSFLLSMAVQVSGYQNALVAQGLLVLAIIWTVIALATWPRFRALFHAGGWRYPVMPVLVAAVIGAVLFGGLTWLWFQRPVAQATDPSRPGLRGFFDGQPRLGALRNGSSVLIFSVIVTNSGTPSIVRDWRVFLGRKDVAGLERLTLIDAGTNLEFETPGNPAGVVIERTSLVHIKTALTAIPTGHAVAGTIVAQAPTLTTEAFREAEVVVRFRDVNGIDYAIRRGLRHSRLADPTPPSPPVSGTAGSPSPKVS